MVALSDQVISITESALLKIKEITKPCEVLRISVEPGGCNGFEYNFTVDSIPDSDDDGDHMVCNGDITVLVIDKVSLSLLSGCILDYERELIGEKFSIKNPNSKSSCSCGASFSV